MDPNAKQQVVEKLKSANNVLVTVSNNPSVDDLAAAIGLSLLLSKLGKHATAVFSGTVPPAIEFLEPNKQFDKDVSGLRDFIIALDKDKADKLRYKVENDVVKIFITPYKTTLSKDDLRFEEGDFNVDCVVALGVNKREDLDNSIKAHGRILHDASVLTINAGENTSSIGVVDWQDPSAGSLCEMLVSISESFGSGLLDEQMSTAFLTGIVAETERFSNPKTSPKVMTMAAQLMAAGANQQLIANNLEMQDKQPAMPPPQTQPTETPPPIPAAPPAQDNSQLKIEHEDNAQPPQQPAMPPPQTPIPPQTPMTPPPSPPAPPTPPLPSPSNQPPAQNQNGANSLENNQAFGAPHEKTLQELESEIADLAGSPNKKQVPSTQPNQAPGPELSLPTPPNNKTNQNPSTGDAVNQTNSEAAQAPLQNSEHSMIGEPKGRGPREIDDDPSLGGTFNATSEQAHEENVKDLRKNINATLLSHPDKKPLKEEDAPDEDQPTSRAKDLEPLSPDLKAQSPAEPAQTVEQQPSETPAPADSAIDIEAARKAVEEAVSSQPFNPAHNPTQGVGSMPIEQASDTQPGAPTEIAIDDSGNLRLPAAQSQPEQNNTGNGQDFQLPTPPNA